MTSTTSWTWSSDWTGTAMSDLIATGRPQADLGIVELQGILDGQADAPLTAAYTEAVALRPPVVLLDFAGVEYINSTGIALIVGLLGRARGEDREVRVCGLTDHYRHIFEITRLADFMTFFATQAEAAGGAVEPA